ncbi:hypothetical protein MASR2M36_04280 [Providencia sp.]
MNDIGYLILSEIILMFNKITFHLSGIKEGKIGKLTQYYDFYDKYELFLVSFLLFFSVVMTKKLLIYLPVEYFKFEAISVKYSTLLLMYCVFGFIFIYSTNDLFIILSLFVFLNLALLLIIIDYKTGYLPDALTYLLLWLGLLYQVWAPAGNVISGVYGVTVSYLGVLLLVTVTEGIKKQTQMGRGDFKLIAACAAWLGVWQLPYFLGLAACLGLIHVTVVHWLLPKLQSRLSRATGGGRLLYNKGDAAVSVIAIPFGPAILISASVWLYLSVI